MYAQEMVRVLNGQCLNIPEVLLTLVHPLSSGPDLLHPQCCRQSYTSRIGGCRLCHPIWHYQKESKCKLFAKIRKWILVWGSMCSSRKIYPYFPHRRDWKFLGECKEMYEFDLEFPGGGGSYKKNPFRGVWKFCGTYTITLLAVVILRYLENIHFIYTSFYKWWGIFNNIIIPQVHIGYEMFDSQEVYSAKLAITFSYPTSVSGIIVLLKTPKEIVQNCLEALWKYRILHGKCAHTVFTHEL